MNEVTTTRNVVIVAMAASAFGESSEAVQFGTPDGFTGSVVDGARTLMKEHPTLATSKSAQTARTPHFIAKARRGCGDQLHTRRGRLKLRHSPSTTTAPNSDMMKPAGCRLR